MMKQSVLTTCMAAVVLTSGVLFAAAPDPAAAARRAQRAALLRDAVLQTNARKFTEARELYEQAAALPDATVAERVGALLALADTYLRENKPDAAASAAAVCERGLALQGIGSGERFSLRSKLGEIWKKAADPAKVVAALTPVVNDPESANAHKLAALDMIANARLDTFDEKAALTLARSGLALPGLTAFEQASALTQLGKLLLRMERYDDVRKTADTLASLAGVADAALQAAKLSADAAVGERRFDKAARLLRAAGAPLLEADVRLLEGRPEAAFEIVLSAVGNESASPAERWGALVKLLDIGNKNVLFDAVRQAWVKHAPPLLQQDPRRASQLVTILRTAMSKGDYAFSAWAAAETLKAPAMARQHFYTSHLYLMNARVALGLLPDAVAAAKAAIADEHLTADERVQFRLSALALSYEGKPGGLREAAAALLKEARDATPSALPERVAKAARTVLMANRELAARELYDLHETLFVPQPKRRYTIPFRSDAPASIDAFLASPLAADASRQAPMDRAFGGDLEMALATDVSTGDRVVASGDQPRPEADSGGSFAAVCDADGIHFFISAKDSQAQAVAAGLAGGGSYEGYFAPGPRQAYVAFMVNLQSGAISTWQSMYDNAHHRQAKTESASRFKGEHRIVGDGYQTRLFFPWELYFDKLPYDGDVWEFDVIRWSGAGGKSWSGCKTIHGRSSLGEIVFAITPAERAAIKRKLLYKAFATYAKEKISRGDYPGVLDYWRDSDLGDPAFYDAELAPLCARFDELAAKVRLEMTDAEVDAIYDEAVPSLLNLKFVIEARRTAYLERQRFAAGTPR